MKIVPSRLMALSRASLHQIDGKMYANDLEFNANWSPTGEQVFFPAVQNTATFDFGDGRFAPVNLGPANEHGRMYMEGGSLATSDKPLAGQATNSGLGTSYDQSMNYIQGYLYHFDSRLPYHFNSVSGLTAGKKYLGTSRGLIETKPKFKRAGTPNRDAFYIGAYNTISTSSGIGQPVQQLIFAETETELFGITWSWIGYPFLPASTSGTQNSTVFWRSPKRADGIDTATGIKLPTNTANQDSYDAAFIGKYGDFVIGLRINSDSPSSAQYLALTVRPICFNLRNFQVVNPPLNAAVKYQVSDQSSAGVRFAPHVRSVIETADMISMYIPNPQCAPAASTDGTCTGMQVKRYDFIKATGVWTDGVLLTVADGAYGDIIAKGTTTQSGTHQAQTIVSSWIIDVQGVNHLVVMMFGGNNYTAQFNNNNNPPQENTHQYVYRMNADGTLTRVSKQVTARLFGFSEVQAGFAMSQNRKAMYLNTYSPRVFRLVFDEVTMLYQHDLQYEVDAWSMHVADDETLTMIDTSLNLIQLKPTMGTAVRTTFGTIGDFDGQPLTSSVNVAVVNHLGVRVSAQVRLELDGPVTFSSNNLQTLVVTTSASEDVSIPVQITGAGAIYCTPVKP